MSSNDDDIKELAQGLNGPTDICKALKQKNPAYLDLLRQYTVTGKSIYRLWVACGRSNDNLIYALEAYRNGLADVSHINNLRVGEYKPIITAGKNLPRSKRLA